MTGLLYALLALVLWELSRSQRPLFSLSLALVAIVLVASCALANDLDLLGVALLAVYSSVFIFLSLLALYFLNRQPQRPALPGAPLVVAFCAALALLASPLLPEAGFRFLWQDLYAINAEPGFQSAHLLHLLFYRICSWETVLLNVYLLFAVVLGVAVFALLGLASHRRLQQSWLSLGRSSRGLWFSRNWRLRGANKIRRQVRHRNSSLVRFKQ